MRTAVVLAALACGAALFAQDEKQVQDAIRGLGAESFEDREKATAELKKIGAPALEALRKAAAESDDPEVRERAKRLVDAIAKPSTRKPATARAPGLPGSRIAIRKSGDATVYGLTPTEGDSIEFHRTAEGKVKLVYPDGKGGTTEAESESIEKFLEDHKGLAEKYGITREGIDYGGSRLSFSGGFPKVFAVPQLPGMPELRELDDLFSEREELRKAFEDLQRWRVAPRGAWQFGLLGQQVVRGAQLSPVPDVLRSQLSIPEGQGVVVDGVHEGSTAAAAGLRRHDVILEIDGEKVTGPGDVRSRLKRDSKVKALRGGKEQELQAAPPPRKDF